MLFHFGEMMKATAPRLGFKHEAWLDTQPLVPGCQVAVIEQWHHHLFGQRVVTRMNNQMILRMAIYKLSCRKNHQMAFSTAEERKTTQEGLW